MTELNTPLEGLRLLDLGRYQAGPRCALMFARMGAEVIKIESLGGDESRRNGRESGARARTGCSTIRARRAWLSTCGRTRAKRFCATL